MAAQDNKKILIGGIAVVVLAIAVVLGLSYMTGNDQQPVARNQSATEETGSAFDSETSPAATRDTPSGGAAAGGRLTGASDRASTAEDSDEDDQAVEKKRKRPKKRRRSPKKQVDEEEEEPESKGGGKRKVIPKPI